MSREVYPSKEDNCLRFGRYLSHTKPDEGIVISGVAGSFPSAENVEIFKDNLYNQVDMITPSRWNIEHPEVPKRAGVVKNAEKFDAGFFGIHRRQAHTMDPMTRMLLEKSVECIMDAGLHPSDLRKTTTGVFVAACCMETEAKWPSEFTEPNWYIFNGVAKFMLSQRISYFLQLKGPTVVIDTACSSSLYALEHAYRAIRLGECDNAIVGGVNMCLHPYATVQFARLGVLSPEACCRPFDKDGRGYVRSDAICAVFLQKAKDSKRIYAQIVHAKTSCDGYKEQGITYPSGLEQQQLLKEFYEECNISPLSLSFIEAHGTGTVVGDPEECHSIDQVFAVNKREPVLIGSVKASIGHSEGASGLASIIKCIIAMENGMIPPNINYNAPKDAITAIKEGRLKVVTENTKFRDDRGLLGVNSFGFGGANCHVLLKSRAKCKTNIIQDDLYRLVCVSSRTKEGVSVLLNDLSLNKMNTEYIKLLQDAFSKDFTNHLYRGFIITSKSGEISRALSSLDTDRPELILVFGIVNNWSLIVKDLMKVPLFLESMKRIEDVLLKKDVHVFKIIKDGLKTPHDILGSVILQVCIADIIKALNVKCQGVKGYSVGEIVRAYYDCDITLEETIYFAYLVEKEFCTKSKKIEKNFINGVHRVNNHNEYLVKENGISETYIDSQNENLFNKLNKVLRSNGTLENGHTALEHFIELLRKPTAANLKSPKNSVVWEIGSTFLKVPTDVEIISFNYFTHEDHYIKLLDYLGRLYLLGCNADIAAMYPKVEFPVSKGTPMISPKIKWNHARDWYVLKFRPLAVREQKTFRIDLSDSNWSFVAGHVIDGRNLFPASGYLYLVWDVFVNMINMDPEYVVASFENCKFIRATTVPQSGSLELNVMILSNSGYFEVTEGDSPVVTGRICLVEDIHNVFPSLPGSLLAKEIPLQSKDVYKELRLRGYNYTGSFKAIKEYKTCESTGLVRWDDNWITFIDNLFQTKILQNDTRLLYVPTSVAKLTIAMGLHQGYVARYTDNEEPPHLPVYYYPEADTIRSGGIEIRGLFASSINRKKYLGTPVLEKYEFVPNTTNLSLYQSVRVNIQIILENTLIYTPNIVEVVEFQPEPDFELLSPIIGSVLEDQPLIAPNIKILSKISLDTDYLIENKPLTSHDEYTLIVVSNAFGNPLMLGQASKATADNGYILTRESKDFDMSQITTCELVIETVHHTATETLILLMKAAKPRSRVSIKLESNENLSWIPELQNAMKTDQEIVLFMENQHLGGIVGLVNCLRQEPGGNNIKCVFLMDQTKPYNASDTFFVKQLNKNMAINIYQSQNWGTYRHLLLEDHVEEKKEHCYVNITVKGDLSSLRWIEGPLSLDFKNNVPEKQLVAIYYSALNFRDIMTATGKINADVITVDRIEQECVQGFEFAGRTESGQRVMGMVNNGAMATMVLSDSHLLWEVPDSWSLAEAATVPVVYGTVIYALFIRGDMKQGESILIHSGTGGIGQAAIRIALHYGCKVFATVGTPEKKEFLKQVYPQLNVRNIGNSHDLSFEQMVMEETHGKGVDLVLNSLAEDKLLASVRCLAGGGRFLEIGKFDISSNNALSLMLLEKNASFHGVMLDKLFTSSPIEKQAVGEYLGRYISNGAIKPLSRSIFKVEEIEQAFRFMASGKHMGKVLVGIREEEKSRLVVPKRMMFDCIPRYSCCPEKSYIIIGGLGGFGLELADWLVLRGARNIILTSRSGIKTGYQQMRVRIWESYGVFVKISTADVTKMDGCLQLINEALELGPLDGIFNLAAVLQDAIFENQTIEKFQKSLAPKALVTTHMDEITRKLCPQIRDFVVFSSVSCGRGNAGQTNYGMANSIMERLCEQRRKDGYAALAIEWGAIGEVGLVAEMQEDHTELEISGTLQQRISSCLQVLDSFLTYKQATIVSSMVVAEKKIGNGSASIVNCVANILGINDIKTVSVQSTLAELGMDSMTAVEIKQTLEREYGMFLTAKDIRSLTIARLKELEEESVSDSTNLETSTTEEDDSQYLFKFNLIPNDFKKIIPLMKMKTMINENDVAPTALLIPGIEGFSNIFEPLANRLTGHAITLQYDYNDPSDSIADLAEKYLIPTMNVLKGKKFVIAGHSYGAIVALELASLLEKQGLTGTVFCIDGSPSLIKTFFTIVDSESEDTFQTNFICRMLSVYVPEDVILQNKDAISRCKNLDERIDIAVKIGGNVLPFSKEEQRKLCVGLYKRAKCLGSYEPSYSSITSRVKLCKPTKAPARKISEDYDLTEICKRTIDIETYQGSHITIVNNEKVIEEMNSCLDESC